MGYTVAEACERHRPADLPCGKTEYASERKIAAIRGHSCVVKVLRTVRSHGNVTLSVCSEDDDHLNERVKDRPAYCSRALCQLCAHGLA
jgi:hypothetical protein